MIPVSNKKKAKNAGILFILFFSFSVEVLVYWKMLPALNWSTLDFSQTKPLGNFLREGQKFVLIFPNLVKLTDKINLHTFKIIFLQIEWLIMQYL